METVDIRRHSLERAHQMTVGWLKTVIFSSFCHCVWHIKAKHCVISFTNNQIDDLE